MKGRRGTSHGTDCEKPMKVIIIGLDGATFRIIDPLLEKEELPNLRSVLESGIRGILKSTVPPTTPPAWTSIFTGMNPGNHGIFDFSYPVPNSYDRRIINSTKRRGRPIWTQLSRIGKSVCVINVPVTYPPDRVNGYMISGMFTPSTQSDFTYPPEFKQELLNKFPDYVIDFEEGDAGSGSDLRERYLHVERITKQLKNLAIMMMEKDEWDFLALVFVGPDRMQHMVEIEIEEMSKEELEMSLLVAHLRTIDVCIGELLERIDDDTLVIICSDHGFRKARRRVHAVNWLAQIGLLAFDGGVSGNRKRSSITELTTMMEGVRSLLNGLHMKKLVSVLDSSEVARRISWFFRKRFMPNENSVFDIDWNRTKAYFVSDTSQAISVNLEAREPEGCVRRGKEYEGVLEAITKKLYELTDPENGQKIVETILRGRDVNAGTFVEEAPDLYILTHEGYALTDGFSLFGLVRDHEQMKGEHAPNGILIMKGPGIKQGGVLERACVEDLVPTILYAMGLPIPMDLDGKILLNAFRNDILTEKRAFFEGSAPGSIVSVDLGTTKLNPDEVEVR